MLSDHGIDLLLLSLSMPNIRAVLEQAASRQPCTKTILLLSEANTSKEIIEAINLGAKGVLLRQSGADELLRAVQEVHQGRTWVNFPFKNVVNWKSARFGSVTDANSALAQRLWNRLTQREREVASLFVVGCQCSQIAERLLISTGTVRVHLGHIYMKLRALECQQFRAEELLQMSPEISLVRLPDPRADELRR